MPMITDSRKLGALELKNRIIFAPMGPHFADINREAVEYFVKRAQGGAAMIMVNMMVTGYFEDTSASLVLTDENIHLFRELCDRAHEAGCKVCVQLMPGCGRMAGPAKMYPVPISASDCGWLYAPNVKCHAMTIEEINILLSEMRRTIKLAVAAGADACELHAYGGYLNDQFLTAAWNTRTDKYGGDVKGRATFLLEQAAIIKEEGGADFPVIVKFCPDHGVPYPGYRKLEEGLELAEYLEAQGIDALHVDVGCHEKWQLAMPPVFYQEAVLQMKAAKAVKEHVSLPVLTNGRLADVSKAEAALENGICDFTVIGRGLLADPELPKKLTEGHPEDIRPCISCNEGCIGNVLKGVHLSCAVNPYTGFEWERHPKKAEAEKKVLVVGGGPGGCTAALMAKEAGHQVELWEKASRIGGKLLPAAAPYMKTDMNRLPNYYWTQLLKAGIPVRLMKEATRETVAEFAPDALIWAAGSNTVRPKSIPGLDRDNVYPCEDALCNLVPLGERVAIIGGGQVGAEAAVHFAHSGHQVTVVEMAEKMMPQPSFKMNDNMMREMLSNPNITCMTSTKLMEVTEEGVVVENADGQISVACDTVLLAMGGAPSAEKGNSFQDLCQVITIGDSNQCRNILTAVHEAYEAVQKI